MTRVWNSAAEQVFGFVRQNDADKVLAIINFSAEPHTVKFSGTLYPGSYREYFSGEAIELDAASKIKLAPWDYRVFVQ